MNCEGLFLHVPVFQTRPADNECKRAFFRANIITVEVASGALQKPDRDLQSNFDPEHAHALWKFLQIDLDAGANGKKSYHSDHDVSSSLAILRIVLVL